MNEHGKNPASPKPPLEAPSTTTPPVSFKTAGELFEYLGTYVDPSTPLRLARDGQLLPVWFGGWEFRGLERDMVMESEGGLKRGDKFLALF